MNIKDLDDRIIENADYIIRTHDTIRNISKIKNLSIGSIYLDLTERLEKIDYNRYLKVQIILKENKRRIGGKINECKNL